MRLFVIIFLCISCSVYSQTTTWQKQLSEGSYSSYSRTLDSGYIVSGDCSSGYIPSAFGDGPFIMKLDKYGNITWTKKYINNTINFYWYWYYYSGLISQLNTGEYAYAGNAYDQITPRKISIAKLDNAGNVLWAKFLHEWNYSEVYALNTTADNGIVITGTASQTDTSKTDLLVSKLDSNGNLLWSKTFDIGDVDSGNKIVVLNNSNILITGTSSSSQWANYSYNRPFMLELDNSGNLIFTKSFFYSTPNFAFYLSDVKELPDHDLIFCGGLGNPMLMRTDSTGNVKWVKTYNDTSSHYPYGSFWALDVLPDNSILIEGEGANWRKILCKIDSLGNPEWAIIRDNNTWWGSIKTFSMFDKRLLLFKRTYQNQNLQISCLDSMGNGACDEPLYLFAKDTSVNTGTVPYTEKPWGTLTITNSNTTDFNMPETPICCWKDSLYVPTSVCQGENVTLYTEGGTSFLWNTGDTTSSISFQAYCNNYYTVAITNQCGTSTFNSYLEVVHKPEPPQVADISICEFGVPMLSTSNDSIVNWYSDSNTANLLGTGISYTCPYNSVGNYTVYCTSTIDGCSSDLASATVHINAASALFTLNPDDGRAPLAVNFFQSAIADSVHWNFGDGVTSTEQNPIHVYTTPGNYETMLVTFTNNCTDTLIKIVKVKDSFFMNIPNVFTPNGDGNNDQFFIEACGISEFALKIFDRWGDKIFESHDTREIWTGGNSEDGTYYYILNYKQNDKLQSKDGFVSLLR